MSSNNGVPQDFIKRFGFSNEFQGLRPGTSEFNSKWKSLATNPEFQQAEHDYIAQTHFLPAAAKAEQLGIPTQDPKVKEAIFSASVQHGGVNNILRMAVSRIRDFANPSDIVHALYEARKDYVLHHTNLSASLKVSQLNRYNREEASVQRMK